MRVKLTIALLIAGIGSAQAQTPGDWVLAKWKNGAYWFPGVIQSVTGDKLVIKYDDGDRETLSISSVRPYDWQIGARVECNFKNGGQWFAGKITALGGESLSIAYDDGDKESTRTGRCRSK
ncbi:MAG: hypothetical protein K2P80_04380 [Beijerinckiaceae bacterium]|nr:hypothetical protein [Beijerinckiaceae bacterium]